MWAALAVLGVLLAGAAAQGKPIHGGYAVAGPAGYVAPCDLVSCAEAYSVTYAMSAGYTGPLFQLVRISDNATLDIGQVTHQANMTTWSAFCGGTQSNCLISKIYAQIHPGTSPAGNDMVPSVFNAAGVNCSPGPYTCAPPFTIEAATGLPIVIIDAPSKFTLAGDGSAVGITAGPNALSIMFNGKPRTQGNAFFGMTHAYNGGGGNGTSFMLVLSYGTDVDAIIPCVAAFTYCWGMAEGGAVDMIDDSGTVVPNMIVMANYDPAVNAVSLYLNNVLQFTRSPPAVAATGASMNPGQHIHFGGAGGLEQAVIRMREVIITNSVITGTQQATIFSNMTNRYTALSFP